MSVQADELAGALRIVLDEYLEAFSRFDIDQLTRFWDMEDPDPLYIAEEIPGRMGNHAAIRAYWTTTSERLDRLWLRTGGHEARPRSQDLAQMVFDMDWACGMAASSDPPIGGSLQVSALLRRRGDRWLFVSWVEAPLAPLPWLRRLYQTAGKTIADAG